MRCLTMLKKSSRLRRELFALAFAALFFAGVSAQEEIFRFRETSESRAVAEVDVSRLSNYVVEERLFGKFSENLGHNIYGGVWAQIFENPSLEPVATCHPWKGYGHFESVELKRLTKEDVLEKGDEKIVAYRWFRWNGRKSAYRLLEDAYNTSYSQAINVRELAHEAEAVGIRQQIFLPIHRELRYELSLFVKDATAPIVAQIMDVLPSKKVFGKITFNPPQGMGWQKISGEIKLSIPKKMSGRPLWFCVGITAPGRAQIDQITIFPKDAIEGFDPEVVALMKAQGISIFRFPGGNYVSGYHWKEDLCPPDKRLTKPNPAWPQIDPRHVATDEYIRLCRLIGAEPMICVNAGNGTAQDAADWIEYCNGSAETRWGSVRAAFGNPEPYNVRVWEIGNELWGDWQIGHCTPKEYARRYREFYTAMKAVDPSLYFLACGDPSGLQPGWNETLIQECPDILHSLTLHFLCTNNVLGSAEYAYLSQMAYSWLFEDFFRRIHGLGMESGVDFKIALTEEMMFNHSLWQPRPETLAEALFFAGTLNSMIRTEGIVDIFTHSAILNHGGNMIKERGLVCVSPVYYALQELRKLSGARPASFILDCPFSDVPEWQPEWAGAEPQKFPLVDIMPLVKDGGLHIIIINRSPDKAMDMTFNISGGDYKKNYTLYELTGESINAMNEVHHPNRVKPVFKKGQMKVKNQVRIENLPPASLSVLTANTD